MSRFARTLLLAATLAATSAGAENHIVIAQSDLTFSPAFLTIAVGDTVTFRNGGGVHNAVSAPGVVTPFRCANGCDGAGGNGNPSSGAWSATVAFNTPGSIDYYCEVHGSPGFGMAGTITVVAATPGAPSGVVATPGNRRLQVSFVPPADPGGSPIAAFTATCGDRSASGPASPLIVDGLVNGIGYTCTVTATNAQGTGPASVPSDPATPFAAPLAPADQYIWMVPPASNQEQQGFLRLRNLQDQPGEVTVRALDSAGHYAPGSIALTLAPNESRQFNSQDLEFGNPGKGLTGSVGDGSGDWTVAISSGLDLETLAYIRTPEGFLTSMIDRVPGDGVDWFVPIFNPAENVNQVSHLRIVNTDIVDAALAIRGTDDAGVPGDAPVTLTVPALAAVDLTAVDLEHGNPGKGLSGAFGNGEGKWYLEIASTARISVQSLLLDPRGFLTNLSSLPDQSRLPGGEKVLWFMPNAGNQQQQGFVRLINRENRAAEVLVWGFDDDGQRSPGTMRFTLGALGSQQFNSQDLEFGNPAKGLEGAIGDGVGDWRVLFATDLDYLLSGFIRTPDGFLTTIHETVPGAGTTLVVPIFNPAENPNQVSWLRLINPNPAVAAIVIEARDDPGLPAPMGAVSLSLAAGAAIELSSVDLEAGNPGKSLVGRFGNGSGKWALTITSSLPIKAMSLLRDPNGYLTNLSGSNKDGDDRLDP